MLKLKAQNVENTKNSNAEQEASSSVRRRRRVREAASGVGSDAWRTVGVGRWLVRTAAGAGGCAQAQAAVQEREKG